MAPKSHARWKMARYISATPMERENSVISPVTRSALTPLHFLHMARAWHLLQGTRRFAFGTTSLVAQLFGFWKVTQIPNSWATSDVVPKANRLDRKSTRLNSSHQIISYAVFCLKKKKKRRR